MLNFIILFLKIRNFWPVTFATCRRIAKACLYNWQVYLYKRQKKRTLASITNINLKGLMINVIPTPVIPIWGVYGIYRIRLMKKKTFSSIHQML